MFNLDHGIDVLERTPATLEALLADLDATWTHSNEGPDTFSPFDVVGHLIHGEKTDWIPRMEIILEEGTSRPFDRYDRFAQSRESEGKTMGELLVEFRKLRASNLATLREHQLTPEQLELHGMHPGLGEVTLAQLLAAWVVHDLGHVAQITRVMAKQLKRAVGPWTEYLPVLSDRPNPGESA